MPSLAWTTFHSWAEVGDWYRKLSLARAQPDAALRARADALTAEARTPDEQVQALYTFVATKTRYVGIDLGNGRFQPHAAADVLSNQYGDCKDKDTLLEALLRAKGFKTAPALIGAGVTPVPEVPSPAVFNHVITTVDLPGGTIWLDSTTEVAPYRVLVSAIRDQEALIVPAEAAAHLQKTPALPPYAFTSSFKAEGVLGDNGMMKSHMVAVYHDDSELMVRALARAIAPAEWDKGSQYISSMTGFGGTTSNTRFSNGADFSKPATLTYDYTRKAYGDWDDLRIVPLSPAIDLVNYSDETEVPEHDIDLGAPRTESVTSSINLPDGWRTDLPDAVHAKSAWATLDKTYHFSKGTILTERTIAVLQPKVPKADWKQYQAFCKQASFDSEPWIQLIRPAAKVENTTNKAAEVKPEGKAEIASPTAVEAKGPAPDMPVDDLMKLAVQQIRSQQFSQARETLDKVRAKKPDQRNLYSYYGWLEQLNHNDNEAVIAYRRELSTHPDDVYATRELASALWRQGKKGESEQAMQEFVNRNPAETSIATSLAATQSNLGENAAAIKTLQTVSQSHPDDRSIRLQLSNALFAADRRDEAAAAAKSVLDGTDDPEMLNDAGYVLAEVGQDLPQAEQVSRESIVKLETKSRAIAPDEVNSTAFRESNLLIASWDTLGWVLFREGKFELAKPYLLASWRNDLHAEVGDHLAQLYESMGDKAGALEQYRLAKASIQNNASAKVREHIAQSIARMQGTPVNVTDTRKAAVEGYAESAARQTNASPQEKQVIAEAMRARLEGGKGQSLQHSRTYAVARRGQSSGWGTFRLQITAMGVQAVQQSSGEPKLQPELAELKTMHFPELVPAASEAWLLRSGVLSCPSTGDLCELVLVPNGNLSTEQ